MATDAQVLAEMEERGIRTEYDDPEYWGVNEDFEAVKNEMEREQYDEIKKFLQHPFIGYAGDKLTKTAAKLHADFLENEEDLDNAVWWDDGVPCLSYKDFFITLKAAQWFFDDACDEQFFVIDLLEGLQAVDSIQEGK